METERDGFQFSPIVFGAQRKPSERCYLAHWVQLALLLFFSFFLMSMEK